MAGRDGADKREVLARRRTIGRIRLAAIGFVLGSVLGASLAAVILRRPETGSEDRFPPSILAVEPNEGALLTSGNTTFRIAFSEALAAPPIVAFGGAQSLPIREESFDGVTWSGTSTIPQGADGSYNLTVVSVRDLARNPMPERATSYLVDTSAPLARAFVAANRTSAPFNIAWEASDREGSGIAHVSLWTREDTGLWIPLAAGPEPIGAFRFDPRERETTFAFCAEAVDRAGNREEPCADEATVDYDATPPGASLLPRAYWALGPTEIHGIAANNASGAELRYYYASDNATWQGPFSGGNATSPFRWTFAFPFGGGHYRLSARGRDARGWVEPDQGPGSSELAIGLDGEAPASGADSLGAYWHAEPVMTFANASDDRSGVASMDLHFTYRPNATATWSAWALATTRVQPPWTFPFEFPGGDGRYELATRARDRAGREEALPPIGQGDVTLAYNGHAPDAATLFLPNFVDPAAKRTNVTWTASPAPDDVRFEVHRGTTASFAPDGMACENSETCVASLTREGRTAWVPLPQENVTYYARVRAIDDGGRATDGNAYGAVFHGLGFDTSGAFASAAPLRLNVAWSERLQFVTICQDCLDVFKVTLAQGDLLSLSLAVPSTGDFRLKVMNSGFSTVDASERSGLGVWEDVAYEATTAGVYYVLVDWSNVFGPFNQNQGWYTLSATVL